MQLTSAILLFTLPIFAILAPLIGMLAARLRQRMLVAYWSILGLFVTLAGVALLIGSGVTTPDIVFEVLSIDSYSAYFTIVFIVITLLISVASINYMRENKNLDTYFALLLLATFGMMLIAFSVDLILLFLAWELMNVPSYVLTGIQKDDPISNEAALKFFILSALSSALDNLRYFLNVRDNWYNQHLRGSYRDEHRSTETGPARPARHGSVRSWFWHEDSGGSISHVDTRRV